MTDSNARRLLPSWRAMHADTAPWAEEIQFKFYREAPAWRKMEMVSQLNQSIMQLAESGLEGRYPNASKAEIRRRLADILLGPELANRVYGPLTPTEGEVVQSDDT